MKKSKAVRLVLLGGTSLALAGCDDGAPTDTKFFASLNDCTAHYSETQCRTMVKEAEEAHVKEAPKFTRKEECEAQFGPGNCETRQAQTESGFGSFFMPMMMGYMMGNMMGNMMNRPVYRDASNKAFTTTPNGKTFNVGSFAGAGRAGTFQPGQITQVNRGGFGQSAANFRSSAGT